MNYDIALAKEALKQLLLAINAADALDEELGLEASTYYKLLNETLTPLKDLIGRYWETNEQLRRFDHIFAEAQWTDRGLRKEYGIVRIVHFSSDSREHWS